MVWSSSRSTDRSPAMLAINARRRQIHRNELDPARNTQKLSVGGHHQELRAWRVRSPISLRSPVGDEHFGVPRMEKHGRRPNEAGKDECCSYP